MNQRVTPFACAYVCIHLYIYIYIYILLVTDMDVFRLSFYATSVLQLLATIYCKFILLLMSKYLSVSFVHDELNWLKPSPAIRRI